MLEIYDTDFEVTVGTATLTNIVKGGARLVVNNQRWMIYNQQIKDHLHLFSSYELAFGDCVLTGLGTGVLSNWLTHNPRVSSITVYEISKDVIEINRQLGLLDNPKINVINAPAQQMANAKCDCLLLDHYELESDDVIINDIKNVAASVDHRLLWFYPAERFIEKQYIRNNVYERPMLEVYNDWVEQNGFQKMPQFKSDELLKTFINLFYNSQKYPSGRKRRDFPHIQNL